MLFNYITNINVVSYSRHSRQFTMLEIPYTNYYFNYILENGLSLARNLKYLDVTAAPIQSLTFLKYQKSLDTLIISECKDIQSKEFNNLQHSFKLSSIYIGFTINAKVENILIGSPGIHIGCSWNIFHNEWTKEIRQNTSQYTTSYCILFAWQCPYSVLQTRYRNLPRCHFSSPQYRKV